MKRFILLLCGLLITTVANAVPSTMTIQGHLANNGVSMDGDHVTIFRLYNAETDGTILWSEQDTIHVSSYLYSTIIGQNVPLPTSIFSQQLWLETTIDGVTLTPRIKLSTSPYAQHAQRADTANVALNGTMSGGQWETNGTDVYRTTGKVGIGTSNPDQTIGLNGMLGVYPGQWLQPTTKGTFMYHQGNVGSIYSYDYPAGRGDTLGFSAAAIGFDTYGANGLYSGNKMWLSQEGNLGIGSNYPNSKLDVRGPTEITDDGGTPDTRSYATFGVTRAYSAANQSYIGLTQQAHIPWGLGISGTGAFIIGGAYTGRIIDPYITVTPNGSVGIRTGNATSTLTVNGTAEVGGQLGVGGNLNVTGNLNVAGTKCRIVMTAYGQIKMNAVESGHALFMDDAPSARLVNGKCRVNLSPKFLATVTVNGKYPLAVNVTFYEQHGGEWFIERDATGFTVIDPSGSNAEFSWQAIARQKGYEDMHLETVETQTAKK